MLWCLNPQHQCRRRYHWSHHHSHHRVFLFVSKYGHIWDENNFFFVVSIIDSGHIIKIRQNSIALFLIGNGFPILIQNRNLIFRPVDVIAGPSLRFLVGSCIGNLCVIDMGANRRPTLKAQIGNTLFVCKNCMRKYLLCHQRHDEVLLSCALHLAFNLVSVS